jgi:hypothetical protein
MAAVLSRGDGCPDRSEEAGACKRFGDSLARFRSDAWFKVVNSQMLTPIAGVKILIAIRNFGLVIISIVLHKLPQRSIVPIGADYGQVRR